jgi:hypothetical protein
MTPPMYPHCAIDEADYCQQALVHQRVNLNSKYAQPVLAWLPKATGL